MKNTKRNRERLIKKLERINSDLALLSDFLSEHLEHHAELHSKRIHVLQHTVVNYQETVRFM